MTKPSNITAIEETTKITWDEWVAYLDDKGARELPHRAIADLAYDRLKDSLDNAGWWSQGVTVAYEQHIGRRQPGQRSDGTFEATASMTVASDMDSTIALWLDYIDGKTEVNGVALTGEPSTTTPKSGRHWAINLADGSRLNADCYPKSDSKTVFTITHAKLVSTDDADRWRAYWKEILRSM